MDKKSYENILVYDAAGKTPYSVKPLCIIFDKVDEFIRKYDRSKNLAPFHSDERYEKNFYKVLIKFFIKSPVCNCFHDVLMVSIDTKSIANLNSYMLIIVVLLLEIIKWIIIKYKSFLSRRKDEYKV